MLDFTSPSTSDKKSKMADKDGHKWTLSVRFSQWKQPEPFCRHYQDSKYVGEKNVFFGGRWSDFPTKLMLYDKDYNGERRLVNIKHSG